MKKIKHSIRTLHLWLGITSGLIIFVIAITGCIYVFSEELSAFFYKDRRIIEERSHHKRLPLDTLLTNAETAIQHQYPCTRIAIPNAKHKSIAFIFQHTCEDCLLYPNYMVFYKTVYLNPYTAEVITIENTKWEFFTVIFWIHTSLFLGYNPISSTIIVWSTWIFVFMLLSGLILWWPKNKSQRKRAFSLQWKKKARWKQKNYKLHKTLGFYAIPIGVVIALTGLFYASPSFNTAIQWIANGGENYTESELPLATSNTITTPFLETILLKTIQQSPTATYFLLRIPQQQQTPFVVRSYMDDIVNYKRHVYYYHPTAATVLATETFTTKNNGEKVAALNYDLHVGSIGGWTTKILWFMISLIIASLPITGFYIWYQKKS